MVIEFNPLKLLRNNSIHQAEAYKKDERRPYYWSAFIFCNLYCKMSLCTMFSKTKNTRWYTCSKKSCLHKSNNQTMQNFSLD